MEINTLIFEIIRSCRALRFLTLPWTSLRYGYAEDWWRLLQENENRGSLCSLEFLSVDLKKSQVANSANEIDRRPLDYPGITFRNLKRLKIFGDSNHMPFTDKDLFKIACTAQNLQEIHVTGTTSLTFNGVMALATASRNNLRILEYSPLSQNGFDRLVPSSVGEPTCLCHQILQFSKLTNLAISLATLCADLFQMPSVCWRGEVQIRAESLCGRKDSLKIYSQAGREQLLGMLGAARLLMLDFAQVGKDLDIEIFMGKFLCPFSS